MDRRFLPLLFALLLAACGDQPAQQWTLATKGAFSAALSPNGQYATVGAIEHGGSLWRLSDGERLYNWNHTQGTYSMLVASTFSTDSRFVITAEKKRMVLWSVESGRPGGFWPVDGGIEALALSDGGRFALVGQANYSANYIDIATGQILQTLPHAGKINAVAISADGRIGVTGAEDGIVKVWDLPKGKETFAYRMGDDISAVALSRDGQYVFGALYYGHGKIWEVKTGKEVAQIGYRRTTMTTARFAADNKTLLTGFTARRVVLWDVKSGKNLLDWRADPPYLWRRSGLVVVDVAFGSKPGEYLSVFSNGLVNLWRAEP
ncbi:MAG: hypothetical protein R3F47_16770 [Gammaproteobacteria bacterium]